MVDPYGYRDAVKNREENISKIYSDLQKGEEDYIRDWIQGVIDEEEPAEDVKEAAELLKRIWQEAGLRNWILLQNWVSLLSHSIMWSMTHME